MVGAISIREGTGVNSKPGTVDQRCSSLFKRVPLIVRNRHTDLRHIHAIIVIDADAPGAAGDLMDHRRIAPDTEGEAAGGHIDLPIHVDMRV